MASENRNVQRTQATRTNLLAVARKLFTTQAFHEVAAEEIVRQARLTRGALYHHFGGKEGLFAALYEEIQQEIAEQIVAAATQAPDAWNALKAGCVAFLQACADPAVQRVVLIDAPLVLGWERWRQLDAQYGLGSLKAGLQGAMESGAIALQPLDPLAHLLLGAMNEAGMWIARSEDPQVALQHALQAFDKILEGLTHMSSMSR